MNRRIDQEEQSLPQRISQGENENLASSIPKTLFWSILAGIGLGIGFFLVRKVGMK